MTVLYEKILTETTSEVRYVVKEFKTDDEARDYLDKRLATFERQGYTWSAAPDGNVECYNEKARKYVVFSIAEKKRIVTKQQYEAIFGKIGEPTESFDDILKKLGWDWDTLTRKGRV